MPFLQKPDGESVGVTPGGSYRGVDCTSGADQEEYCTTGIRIVEEALVADPTGVAVLTAIADSALEILDREPGITPEDLADELATAPHFGDSDEGRTIFVWGAQEGATAKQQAVREVVPGITTRRVAQAVATCATRNCPLFHQSLSEAQAASTSTVELREKGQN